MVMKKYYPIFIDLTEKRCLVIGGGRIAERKVKMLVEYGAKVSVISPELSLVLEQMARDGEIEIKKRKFTPGDTEGFTLVIAATNAKQVNAQIVEETKTNNILCNIVDRPDLCSFIAPSVIRRGPLQIAISTGGNSPALSKAIRQKIETEIGEEYGKLAELLGNLRDEIKEEFSDNEAARSSIWGKIVYSEEILSLLREGRYKEVQEIIAKCRSQL